MRSFLIHINGYRQKKRKRKYSYLAASLILQVTHNVGKRVCGALRVSGAAVLKISNLLPVLDNLLGGQVNVNGESVATSLLPAGSGAPTTANLVESASGVRADVAAESENQRRNIVGLEGLEHLRSEDRLGHGSTSVRSNGVDIDVVLGTLDSKSARETQDTAFLTSLVGVSSHGQGQCLRTYSSRVVGLAEVSVNTGSGGGVDDTAVLLLEEVRPGSLGNLVSAAKVDVEDWVPQAVVHVGESLVTKNTSIVDNDINAAKCVDGGLNTSFAVLSRGLDTNSLAAKFLDLLNNVVGVDQIVDHEGGTSFGKSKSIGAANTGASTSDEHDLASVVNLLTLLSRRELGRVLRELNEVGGLSGVGGTLGEVNDLVPVLDDGAGSVGGVRLEKKALSTLPAEFGSEATADLVDATSVASVALMDKDTDHRDNVLGLKSVEKLGREDGVGQAGRSWV